MRINGSIVQAYVICKRQAWLMSRQVSGNQYNEFMAIGKLLDEESYKRDKKEIRFGSNKIDIIRGEDQHLTIIETKKSSKGIKAAIMQLLFYLQSISKKGYKVKGVLKFPKERKNLDIPFDKKSKRKINKLIGDIRDTLKLDTPPLPIRISSCKKCSYNEFCWS